MRTLIDIDEKLLKQAMKLTRAKTKKEVVNLGLKELVRRKRIEELKSMAGKLDLDLDLKKLEKIRSDE